MVLRCFDGCPVSVGSGAQRYRKVGLDGVGRNVSRRRRKVLFASLGHHTLSNGEAGVQHNTSSEHKVP